MNRFVAAAVLAIFAYPAESVAAPAENALIEALGKCLDIADDAQRLACTDVAGRQLVDAARKREFVTIDRDEVRKTRSELFGFPLPSLGLFDRVLGKRDGGGKAAKTDEPGVDILETKIGQARAEAHGIWTLTMDSGALWQTTEPWTSPRDPRAGAAVTIKRGAFGGFTLIPAGGRPVRVRRIG